MPYTPDNPYIPGDPYSYDLKWLVAKVKELISDYAAQQAQITGLTQDQAQLHLDFQDLKNYVENYFANLDVTQEISDKLQAMFDAGDFDDLLNNDNMLVNPFFTVNQKGAASYSANEWTVDRWHRPASDASGHKITLGSVELPDVKGDVYQNPGLIFSTQIRSWTLSAIIDGDLYSYTFTSIADGSNHDLSAAVGLDGLRWHYIERWSASSDLVAINNGGATADHVISAIKLEPGLISTLPADTAPNYENELNKCKYFYTDIGASSNLSIGLGMANSATLLNLPISIGPKKSTPSISLSANLLIGKELLSIPSTAAAWFSFDPESGTGTLNITTSGLTPGDAYRVGVPANEKLAFSSN